LVTAGRTEGAVTVFGSVARLLIWLACFAAFYQSGLALTTCLPGSPAALGGMDRALAMLFPLLLIIFPGLNRYCRRRGGLCRDGHCGL